MIGQIIRELGWDKARVGMWASEWRQKKWGGGGKRLDFFSLFIISFPFL